MDYKPYCTARQKWKFLKENEWQNRKPNWLSHFAQDTHVQVKLEKYFKFQTGFTPFNIAMSSSDRDISYFHGEERETLSKGIRLIKG